MTFNTELEGFTLGVDPIPDWFMDRVSHNLVILQKSSRKILKAYIHTPYRIRIATHGDFVYKDLSGGIGAISPPEFERDYVEVDDRNFADNLEDVYDDGEDT